jgi:hypothetical protein
MLLTIVDNPETNLRSAVVLVCWLEVYHVNSKDGHEKVSLFYLVMSQNIMISHQPRTCKHEQA